MNNYTTNYWQSANIQLMVINSLTTNGDQHPYNSWQSTVMQLMAINSHTTYEVDNPVPIGNQQPYN
jgi:hypothetical protein